MLNELEVAEEPRTDEPATESPPEWGLAKKLLFRFALLYFLIYAHPAPLNWVPSLPALASVAEVEWAWVDATTPFYEAMGDYYGWWRDVQWASVDFVAESVLGIEEPLDRPYGSGDTTHSYIAIAIMLCVALLGAILWSVFDRRRTSHPFLAPWFHLLARYLVAFAMFTYGFIKVIPTQFGPAPLSRLVTDFGHGSPMNLLWSFMGASTGYIVFTGLCEVAAGVLLCFRRTATLGALLAAAVMANVFALNVFYDTPVKLYSSHLFLFAAGLCLPDVGRIFSLFVLQRATQPRDLVRPRLRTVGHVVRLIVVGSTLALSIPRQLDRYEQRQERSDLYGIWEVAEFRLDGDDVPPLLTDEQRWRSLLIEGNGSWGYVRGMEGDLRNAGLGFDEEAGTLRFTSFASWGYSLDGDEMRLEGEYDRYFYADPLDRAKPGHPVDPQIAMDLFRVSAPFVAPPVEAAASPGESGASEGASALPEGEDSEAQDAESGESTEGATEAPAPPPIPTELLGVWETVRREVIGDFLGNKRSDPTTWQRMELLPDGKAMVTFSTGRVDEYRVSVDAEQGRLSFQTTAMLEYEHPEDDPERISLSGDLRGHALEVELRRRDREYLLVTRGFHWINEVPLTRY